MLRMTIAGLRLRAFRLLASLVAIVLGVGFVAGTLIFADTAKAALFDQFARAAKNVDVAVDPPLGPSRDPRLPLSTLNPVRQVPGVAAADGRIQEYLPLLDRNGKLVGNSGRPGLGLSAGSAPALRPYDVVAGRAPASDGEAALDVDTAARTGYTIGDTATVLDVHQSRHRLTVVGLVSFGTSKQYAGQAVVVATAADLALLTGTTGYREIVVSAAPGVTPSELSARIAAAMPAGSRLRTGSQYRTALATDAMNQLNTYLTVLLIFAIVACVVAAFVIYNTFAIVVAQRVREIALLRCVGASRAQVFRSVLLESALVGLAGAVAGVALGVAIGYGLFSGVSLIGRPLPAHGVVITATPVAVAILVGVTVTVAAAVGPAWRATRVPPVAALRALPLGPAVGMRRRALLTALAGFVAALGTLLTVVAPERTGDATTKTVLVVTGGLVNFLAVLIASPLFVGNLTMALGWTLGRVVGTPATLAAANARRNPGRTAVTTAALMIGVGLMSAASVALATVRVTATHQLAVHYPVDYVVMPGGAPGNGAGVPAALAGGLRTRSEFGAVAEVRTCPATLDGTSTVIGTMDPAGLAALGGSALTVTAGSITDLRHGTVVLFSAAPAARGRQVGDSVTLATPGGHVASFRVVALASGRSQSGDAVIGWDDFAALHATTVDNLVLVRAAHGIGTASSRAALESVTDDYPQVRVASDAEWRAQITRSVDTMIRVVAALLAIAILIALVGITNTLSLSVFERTRESALLRAVGLTRGQLRAMLVIEALLMGLVGGIVGVSFGVVYGWATTRVMFTGFAAVPTFPIGQLLAYVGLAALTAAFAALLPARRATGRSIVVALSST